MMIDLLVVFFFKKKTAYEMRISEWSSDVCSSDLVMAKQFAEIGKQHRDFIERQHIFFTASAAPGSRINLSPKDAASLRVLGPNQVAYLDCTGSGNETRSEERRVGKEGVSTCRSRWSPDH